MPYMSHRTESLMADAVRDLKAHCRSRGFDTIQNLQDAEWTNETKTIMVRLLHASALALNDCEPADQRFL